MSTEIFNQKKVYNLQSDEEFNRAKIIGGNPSGIINFNSTNHQFALNIYKLMEANQWFPSEANIGQDKHPYSMLSDEYRYAYDMALSQLISNDSIQTHQLVDSINRYITSPVVNAALTLQAYQEANHSKSYSVMVEEVCEDSDRIYNMHKHNAALARKNNAVASMYSTINNSSSSNNNPSLHDLQLAFAANLILERLVFPGGFVVLWSMGKTMTGTAKMIQLIERDETATHVPLFHNIFRESVREYGIQDETKQAIRNMIIHMTEEEIEWTKHLTSKILGFSDQAITMYIQHLANDVCKSVQIDYIYQDEGPGPLQNIYDSYSIVSGSKKKSNFFETAVSTYSINTIDDDY